MPHQAWMITRTQRNRSMSVGSMRWKNYSAVPMHRIFGRRYKSGIRNMQPIWLMTVIQTDTKTALTDNAYFIHHPERIVHTMAKLDTDHFFAIL